MARAVDLPADVFIVAIQLGQTESPSERGADMIASANRRTGAEILGSDQVALELRGNMAKRCPHRAIVALALAAALAFAYPTDGYSASTERCEYPHAFGPTLAQPGDRSGEFRITLSPPNYSDEKSIREHFIFSSLLGALLRTEIRTLTEHRCRALISTSAFPDLRAFLVEGKPADSQQSASPCTGTLQDVLLNSKPSDREIASSVMTEVNQRSEAILAKSVYTILKQALAEIYEAGTVMRALVSIESRAFQEPSGKDFAAWLQSQRSTNVFGMQPLQFCDPAIDPASPADTGAERLPYSRTIPPRSIDVQIDIDGATLPASLQHVVIVGEGPAVLFSMSPRPAIEKYCNQQLSVSLDTTRSLTVQVRCLRSVQFNDAWTVFYCEPASCTSDREAAAVARQISEDPVVTSLAKDTAWKGQIRGPYRVNTRVESR